MADTACASYFEWSDKICMVFESDKICMVYHSRVER